MSESALHEVLLRLATDRKFADALSDDPDALADRHGLTAAEAATVLATRIDTGARSPGRLEERLSRSGLVFGADAMPVVDFHSDDLAAEPEPEPAPAPEPVAEAAPPPAPELPPEPAPPAPSLQPGAVVPEEPAPPAPEGPQAETTEPAPDLHDALRGREPAAGEAEPTPGGTHTETSYADKTEVWTVTSTYDDGNTETRTEYADGSEDVSVTDIDQQGVEETTKQHVEPIPGYGSVTATTSPEGETTYGVTGPGFEDAGSGHVEVDGAGSTVTTVSTPDEARHRVIVDAAGATTYEHVIKTGEDTYTEITKHPDGRIETTTYAPKTAAIADYGSLTVKPSPDGTTYEITAPEPIGARSFTADDPSVTTDTRPDGSTLTTMDLPDLSRHRVVVDSAGTTTLEHLIPNEDGSYTKITTSADGSSDTSQVQAPKPAVSSASAAPDGSYQQIEYADGTTDVVEKAYGGTNVAHTVPGPDGVDIVMRTTTGVAGARFTPSFSLDFGANQITFGEGDPDVSVRTNDTGNQDIEIEYQGRTYSVTVDENGMATFTREVPNDDGTVTTTIRYPDGRVETTTAAADTPEPEPARNPLGFLQSAEADQEPDTAAADMQTRDASALFTSFAPPDDMHISRDASLLPAEFDAEVNPAIVRASDGSAADPEPEPVGEPPTRDVIPPEGLTTEDTNEFGEPVTVTEFADGTKITRTQHANGTYTETDSYPNGRSHTFALVPDPSDPAGANYVVKPANDTIVSKEFTKEGEGSGTHWSWKTRYADGHEFEKHMWYEGKLLYVEREPTPWGHLVMLKEPHLSEEDDWSYLVGLDNRGVEYRFDADDPSVQESRGYWDGNSVPVTAIRTPEDYRVCIIDGWDKHGVQRTYVYAIPNGDGTYEQTTKHPDGWTETVTVTKGQLAGFGMYENYPAESDFEVNPAIFHANDGSAADPEPEPIGESPTKDAILSEGLAHTPTNDAGEPVTVLPAQPDAPETADTDVTYPGVYVDEIPSPPATIPDVDTGALPLGHKPGVVVNPAILRAIDGRAADPEPAPVGEPPTRDVIPPEGLTHTETNHAGEPVTVTEFEDGAKVTTTQHANGTYTQTHSYPEGRAHTVALVPDPSKPGGTSHVEQPANTTVVSVDTDPQSGVRTTTYADRSMDVAVEFSDGSTSTAHVEPTSSGHLSVGDNPNDGTTTYALIVGEWPNGNYSSVVYPAGSPGVTSWAGGDGTTVTTIHSPDDARYSIINHPGGEATYVYVIPNGDGTYEQTTKHPDGWTETETLVPKEPGNPELVEP